MTGGCERARSANCSGHRLGRSHWAHASCEIGARIAPHRGGDGGEIVARHAYDSEAKGGAPMVLVADEAELLEQRLDRRGRRIEIRDVAPTGPSPMRPIAVKACSGLPAACAVRGE